MSNIESPQPDGERHWRKFIKNLQPGAKISLEPVYQWIREAHIEASSTETFSELTLEKHLAMWLEETRDMIAYCRIQLRAFAIHEEDVAPHENLLPLPAGISPDVRVGTVVEYENELWVVVETKRHADGDKYDWENIQIARLRDLWRNGNFSKTD